MLTYHIILESASVTNFSKVNGRRNINEGYLCSACGTYFIALYLKIGSLGSFSSASQGVVYKKKTVYRMRLQFATANT